MLKTTAPFSLSFQCCKSAWLLWRCWLCRGAIRCWDRYIITILQLLEMCWWRLYPILPYLYLSLSVFSVAKQHDSSGDVGASSSGVEAVQRPSVEGRRQSAACRHRHRRREHLRRPLDQGHRFQVVSRERWLLESNDFKEYCFAVNIYRIDDLNPIELD